MCCIPDNLKKQNWGPNVLWGGGRNDHWVISFLVKAKCLLYCCIPQEAAENRRYNIATWVFAAMYGEFRWLHTGRYGDLTYSTFDYKMIKPLKQLME